VQNKLTSEVRFRALLAEGGTKRLELTTAERVLRARLPDGADALASMRNCIHPEVRFRALLSQDETRQLEVVRA
jgi:hypothetical protein